MNKIIFMGCGKMGSALMNSWLKSGQINKKDIFIADASAEIIERYDALGFKAFSSSLTFPEGLKAAVIVLAVKPDILESALKEILPFIDKNTLVISIAAGKTIGFIESFLPSKQPVVRIMPNMCVDVGLGVSGMLASKSVSAKNKEFLNKLMEASGLAFWVKKEEELHSVTAVSGSSPAYVYNFASEFSKAIEEYGFPKKQAQQIAVNVLLGSVLLFAKSGDSLSAATARIATPKGTTEQAVLAFNKNDALLKLCKKAMSACVKRSKELAK